MPDDTKHLKKQIKKLLAEHLAIVAFFGNSRAGIEKERAKVQKAVVKGTRQVLTSCVRNLRTAIAHNRHLYEVKVPNAQIVEIITLARNAPKGRELRIAKPDIERVCNGYGKVYADFDDLPVHARIVIEPEGRRPSPARGRG